MDDKEYSERLIFVATKLVTAPRNCYSTGAEGVRVLMSDAKSIVDSAISLAAARAKEVTNGPR
jgi:hypothetical protein